MYRTVTDLAYSRSPECPFIIDELSMADLRNLLHRYEDEKTLIPPDAQVGIRKSIAAALGERKGWIPEGGIPTIVYHHSVDVEHTVNDFWGPHQLNTNETDSGSGTMSMDFGTEYGSPAIPQKLACRRR